MSNNVYKGADFQCDQTEGFPVSLCYDWDEETAYLELNYSMVDDDTDVEYYEGLCKEWGTRPCYSWEDYNDYLSELGREAYNNAAVLDEEVD